MKPIVHYTDEAEFSMIESVEGPVVVAKVYALDHPRLGQGWVRTSIVVDHSDDGQFETMNTIYKPWKDKNEATV